MLYYGQNSVPYDGNAQSSHLLETDCPGETRKWQIGFVFLCPGLPSSAAIQQGWVAGTSVVFVHNIYSIRENSSALCRLIPPAIKIFRKGKPQGLQLMGPCLGLLKGIWLVSRIFWVHTVLQLCKFSLQHNKTLTGKTHQAARSLHGARQFSGSINLAIKTWRSSSRHAFSSYKDVQPFHRG